MEMGGFRLEVLRMLEEINPIHIAAPEDFLCL
jgi:hypothetical protein